MRCLNKVQYVSDLKKNLISLGFLESKGFRIDMHNGILSVLYGAMVVMKATCRNNLYYLKGSTVVGEATTVVEKLGEFASDTTRLWHICFGHAGEKALQGLVKQDLLKGTKT
jgi:hypothetical protein